MHNLHQTQAELSQHLQQARAAASAIGVQFLGLGFDPRSRVADLECMPKERYKLLDAYLKDTELRADASSEMLFNTTTTQVRASGASA